MLSAGAVAALFASPLSAEAEAPKFDAHAYRFTKPTAMRRCTLTGDDWTDAAGNISNEIAKRPWRFYVVNQTPERLVIQFLLWPDGSTLYDTINVAQIAGQNDLLLWCVALSDAAKSVEEFYLGSSVPNVNFGALVVPIKLRGGVGSARDVTFTTDVSLAGALDINWSLPGTSRWFAHLLVFGGVGIVKIEPRESALAESRNVPAFSSGIGVGFSGTYGGAGLLLGLDVINGNGGGEGAIEWVYQGRPWLGISIGATFGTQESPSGNEQ